MAEPTLQNVFGANASQDANFLIISKADLALVGLTPSASNTGESLLAALLKVAFGALTSTNQVTNPDQHIVIQSANSTIYESAFGTRLRQNLLVSFDSGFNNPGIIPNNY